MELMLDIFADGFFAAIAAIGFASISNTPRSAMAYCAVLAAIGHSIRFVMMNEVGEGIILSSALAAIVIGVLGVFFAKKAFCPPETFSYPALLPMIPGMYAYRTIEGLVMCVSDVSEDLFHHYLYIMSYNAMMCACIVMVMVIGVTMPIFIFKRISFSSTRV